MLIIVSREHGDFYRSLQPAQEATGRDRVILDRRVADRRQGNGPPPGPERRRAERRAPMTEAERALMRVLGFAVINLEERHATGDIWSPTPAPVPVPKPARVRRRLNATG
jgi:hypothetical protein